MNFASAICTAALVAAAPAAAASADEFDQAAAARFAALALDCVHKEYPNKVSHVMQSAADAGTPRQFTPAFYGCYDWHSAVHGHWLLARLARTFPQAPFAADARAALAQSITAQNMAAEAHYMAGEGRKAFERPYGLAWLLQLAAELQQWPAAAAQGWAAQLQPLVEIARGRLMAWLPNLDYAIRVGTHSQTAFSFGLILDWARAAGDAELAALVEAKTRAFYLPDKNCPLHYEPSGHDFLSPCIAEADLVRRILPPAEFAEWLGEFLPGLPRGDGAADAASAAGWLPPARVSDRSDGHLAHLDGLNLSRAWMLEGVAAGLPPADTRRPALLAAAAAHKRAGIAATTGEHYEGGHWLGSFAVYLATKRGLN